MTTVNAPLTIWDPTNGNGEAVTVPIAFLVDTLGNFLVDTLGNFIVGTGTDFTQLPLTLWTENDGQ